MATYLRQRLWSRWYGPARPDSGQSSLLIWGAGGTMQVDALKQKTKPSEVVVTPVQTPQPVSGTPVILTPPPVSLVTPASSPYMPSTHSTCSSSLTAGICKPVNKLCTDRLPLPVKGTCSLCQKQAAKHLTSSVSPLC